VRRIDLDTPLDAERSFYDAFRTLDLDAMRHIWDASDEIVCVHPWADSLTGNRAVMTSWETILSGGSPTEISHSLTSSLEIGEFAFHHGHEQLTFNDAVPTTTVIVVTNAFRLTEHGWRMTLHHGSPIRGGAASLSTTGDSSALH
jgi:hypothetical protein